MKDREFVLADQGSPQEPVKPKIGTIIGEINLTLRSTIEVASNIKRTMCIVSGSQIDTNYDFSELSQDSIPDDLLAIHHNCRVLSDSLQKILETLENAL